MKYKIIHWNTGYAGSLALKYVLANKDLELVGLKCWSESKEGKDAGELVGLPPVGVKATQDTEALLAMDADCVVYMGSDGPGADPTSGLDTPLDKRSREHFELMLRILESGKNIVTPLPPPTYYMHFNNPAEFIGRMEMACAKGNSSIHYAGVDPGYYTDQFALQVAAGMGIVNRIDTWEVLNYGDSPHVEEFARLGFGMLPQELDGEQKRERARVVWGGLSHLMAKALRVQLDGTEIDLEFWLAPEDFTANNGMEIGKGRIGAFKLAVKAISDGKPFHVINHVTRMAQHAAPDWPRIGHDGGYRVEVKGSMPLTVDIPLDCEGGAGGNAGNDSFDITASVVVNRIRDVIEATPGYKTFLDLGPLRPICTIPA